MRAVNGHGERHEHQAHDEDEHDKNLADEIHSNLPRKPRPAAASASYSAWNQEHA